MFSLKTDITILVKERYVVHTQNFLKEMEEVAPLSSGTLFSAEKIPNRVSDCAHTNATRKSY